ncbi:MAG: leucine--tRNA ligase [Firmicutes bacterium]|nr:leucine--tRNA ligase [Bacillota bacterium]MCL2256055.1 leucine--tRNA ligase [Bacillota bacterium]
MIDFKLLDKKWNDYWEKHNLNKFNEKNIDKKYYSLVMFSYPSASNLHLGHWYNYAPADTFSRFKRMQGHEVFAPMGFDSFGLPAENFAIKTGTHPMDSTNANIKTMQKQLAGIGAMYDPSSYLETSDPSYYKFTQWLFLKLFEKGLAYQKLAPVNFCTSCQTVIANEQVIDNKCERCSADVEKREMTQWFFSITKYAEELLQKLDTLDWPSKTVAMQKNWIGKSTGGEISFELECDDCKKKCNEKITVFTTRADTVFGVSYVVLAPEHPFVEKITTEKQKKEVQEYVKNTLKISDLDRQTSKEKTGVFTGAYCVNPANGEKIPVYIADYCLMNYGTGAVMAVPAHDERDFEFANKYNLPIKKVIESMQYNGQVSLLPFVEKGVLINSGAYSGLESNKAIRQILKDLEKVKKGQAKTNYRLRDWSVSRQRYWGAPIPIVHCEKCGIVPVPEKDLPIELPYNVQFTRDGVNPLSKCEEFINTTCPKCKKSARRESDTLDTFVCSSWYFLRYPDANNATLPFDTNKIAKMLPVDKYIGGAEHACMHLLYSRFITKAFRDMGYLNFDEPFASLVHQGLILGKDGFKMSKSRGNVVNPDLYVNEHGSDVFRMYLMFGFSFIEGGAWNDDGILALKKFLERVWRLVEKVSASLKSTPFATLEFNFDLSYAMHYAIKHVTEDLEKLSFNTAIARLMELVNSIYKHIESGTSLSLVSEVVQTLIKLLAPFAPHIAEELHQIMGGEGSVFSHQFPVCDENALVKLETELAVQVNSKIKSKVIVPTSATNEEIEKIALADEKVIESTNGANPKKVIIIKDRLINIIV